MIHRILKPLLSQSFFIFGARGVGKSTFVREQIESKSIFSINFLESEVESRYLQKPDLLINDLAALKLKPEWIFIDEVQKVPKILDIVHLLIEEKKYKFILTGSSARKLKKGAANLLAGRAFTNYLFPLTHEELGHNFSLEEVLNWGSLPKIFSLNKAERIEFLRSYCQTYLKEEILQEQIVRNGQSFRRFLEVAAQENGKTLNFSKIARDINVDTKTAQSYFQILEDTLVGFFLTAFHTSARKSVKQQPKFYLFDLGVKKALELSIGEAVSPRTATYGLAFEHFIICECFRLNQYMKKDFSLYHFQTNTGGEIDLILQKGKKTIAVEIKSADRIDEVEVRKFDRTCENIRISEKYFVSQDPKASLFGGVECLHWKDFFKKIFANN